MTAERLRELLDYNEDTGVFTWRIRLGLSTRVGQAAGTVYKNGRRYITIERKRYFSHRLAWLYVHGAWPVAQIDHKNLNCSDDRIDNLRPATNLQNAWNKGILSTNHLGVKGVGSTYRKHFPQRYRARIRVHGKLIHLGYFSTPELASAAYAEAAVKNFGEFARVA